MPQNHVKTQTQNHGRVHPLENKDQNVFPRALPWTLIRGAIAPHVTPLHVTTCGKKITQTQHSPTCCFLSAGSHRRAESLAQLCNTHFFSTPRELLSAHRLRQCICNIIQSVHLYQQHPFSFNHISHKVILNINVLCL